MKRAMLLCVFAIFVILVVGSSYLVGRETGQWKGWDEGYWRGMHDEWYKAEVFKTIVVKDRWVKFRVSDIGIHWDALKSPELDRRLFELDMQKKTVFSRVYESGVTMPESAWIPIEREITK